MRPLLLLAVLLAALPARAQSPNAAPADASALAGTWYSLQDVRLTFRTSTDTVATTVETTSNVMLDLAVDGSAVTGEERREMAMPVMPGSGAKDPMTFTSVLDVEGTVEGAALRLTMTTERGDVFRYEGTFDADGRRLTLHVVPEEPVPDAEPVTIVYERAPPKPRETKD